MLIRCLPFLFAALLAACGVAPVDSEYRNPILHADYSDPDVLRVGEDFYMTASSFNCIPGLPILRSKDLVNWTLVGHALTRQAPYEVYRKPQHGNGCSVEKKNDSPSNRKQQKRFFGLYELFASLDTGKIFCSVVPNKIISNFVFACLKHIHQRARIAEIVVR